MEVPKVLDPLFGLVYDDGDWWYGETRFVPANKEIGVMIICVEEAPDERHRQFYRELEHRYFYIQEEIGDALFKTLTQEFHRFSRHSLKKCKREDLWLNCCLESATIPAIDAQPLTWDLSYYCDWSDCNYDIHMDSWQILEVENIGG